MGVVPLVVHFPRAEVLAGSRPEAKLRDLARRERESPPIRGWMAAIFQMTRARINPKTGRLDASWSTYDRAIAVARQRSHDWFPDDTSTPGCRYIGRVPWQDSNGNILEGN
jgi:hypothetical protein